LLRWEECRKKPLCSETGREKDISYRFGGEEKQEIYTIGNRRPSSVWKKRGRAKNAAPANHRNQKGPGLV